MSFRIVLLVTLLCSVVDSGSWHDKIYGDVLVFQEHHVLPDLPYKYDELEPHIDVRTLRVHHLGHHEAYTNKMNAVLKEWRREVSSKSVALPLLMYSRLNHMSIYCHSFRLVVLSGKCSHAKTSEVGLKFAILSLSCEYLYFIDL